MTTTELFANQAQTTVSSGGTTAPAQGTVETWTVASSAGFPSASTGASTFFRITDPAQPSEKMLVTNVSGTTWTVTRGAEGTTPIAHTTGFTVQNVITAAALAALISAVQALQAGQPYQFLPENFGAKGDGKVIYDATISAGSLSTLTSATAAFTSADTGKTVAIDGALGATVTALIATITYVSATTVTLSTPATAAVTNSYACYGTDDTSAFNACIAAMTLYGKGHNWYAEMLLRAAIYVIAGPLIQGGGSLCNAQIPLPLVLPNASPTLVLAFTGVKGGQGAGLFSASGSVPGPDWSGTVLFCMLTGQSYSATFGPPSMIGGPTSEQGYSGAFTNKWNNVIPVVTGITCIGQVIPTLNMLDFRSCARMHMEWGRCIVFTSFSATASYGSPAAQGPAGLVTPQGGNNAYAYIGSYTSYGFGSGIVVNESVWAGFLGTYLCDTGIYYNESSDGHGVTIGRWSAEANNTHLFVGGGATGPMPFNVQSMETENISQWTTGYFINDGGNALGGRINISNSLQNGAALLSASIIGAKNCEIIYQGQGNSRGAQTPPSMPSSGAAFRNPFWDHCSVTITGGNVSQIAIDGVNQNLSSGTVTVPSGSTITITYTSAPSWTWEAL